MAKLEKPMPPDLIQCQSMIPTGHNFMTFGPGESHKRCTAEPIVIATEVKKAKGYTKKGSMSLCLSCWIIARRQLGKNKFTIEPIEESSTNKEKSFAPWTIKQIEMLVKRQHNELLHDYSCICGASLVPTKEGWICTNCNYTQNWCHKMDVTQIVLKAK